MHGMKVFFFKLRGGIFDLEEFESFKKDFRELAPNEIPLNDREILRLTWFIPLFISWQEERLLKNGISEKAFMEISDFFFNSCEQLYGLP
jgi:hypothetical protein